MPCRPGGLSVRRSCCDAFSGLPLAELVQCLALGRGVVRKWPRTLSLEIHRLLGYGPPDALLRRLLKLFLRMSGTQMVYVRAISRMKSDAISLRWRATHAGQMVPGGPATKAWTLLFSILCQKLLPPQSKVEQIPEVGTRRSIKETHDHRAV